MFTVPGDLGRMILSQIILLRLLNLVWHTLTVNTCPSVTLWQCATASSGRAWAHPFLWLLVVSDIGGPVTAICLRLRTSHVVGIFFYI